MWFNTFTRWDGQWFGNNIKHKVLREEDFVLWYNDGDPVEGAWIQPGQTAVCDPNWHCNEPNGGKTNMKWAFLAVDADGNSYFDEAEVSIEATKHVTKGTA